MIPLKFIIVMLHLIAVVYSQTQCNTPNGEVATCVPINRCPTLFHVIHDPNPRTRQFLSRSLCLFRRIPFVCCGTLAGYIEQPPKSQFSRPLLVRPKPARLQPRKPQLANPPPLNLKPAKVSPCHPNKNSNKPIDPKLHRNINLLPPKGRCGRQGLMDRIYGGTEADLDEFPWMALLRYKKNGQDVGFNCGGVLINDRYVLTAAHCVTGIVERRVGNLFQVRLGEHNISSLQDCVADGNCNNPPQDIDVEEIVFNNEYDARNSNQYNDIALLRLSNRAQLTFFVEPICLPLNNEETSPGINMTIAGWGATETASRSNVKMKANVPIIEISQCANSLNIIRPVSISNNQFCAGGLEGVDSCSGDSGGPIMNLLSDQETWYAEGLVSYGPSICGVAGMPGVYTRISSYLNWILDNMRP